MIRQYLFLCHAGQKRSPTAASVARAIAVSRDKDIEMIYGSSDAINIDNQNHMGEYLSKYEKIFVMQGDIEKRLKRLGIENSRIFCLDIPDNYERQDPQLREILREKLEGLI